MVTTAKKQCRCREGKKQCVWWLTGCLNPKVPLDEKRKHEKGAYCGSEES